MDIWGTPKTQPDPQGTLPDEITYTRWIFQINFSYRKLFMKPVFEKEDIYFYSRWNIRIIRANQRPSPSVNRNLLDISLIKKIVIKKFQLIY